MINNIQHACHVQGTPIVPGIICMSLIGYKKKYLIGHHTNQIYVGPIISDVPIKIKLSGYGDQNTGRSLLIYIYI